MKRHFHMDIPVLVIGAGPVGLITALSLAEQGVQSLIVERRTQRYGAPKAHAVNARTLEICERLGVSADHIRAEGRAGRMGEQLMAIAAEGDRRRIYLSPSQGHVASAAMARLWGGRCQRVGGRRPNGCSTAIVSNARTPKE